MSRDATEGAQPRHRVGPRLAGRDLLELLVKGSDLHVETAKVGEHVLKRRLGERIGQALGLNPRAVAQGPRLALTVDVPVAHERLGHAMTGCGARAAQIITAAHQVAQALLHR